MKAIALNLLPQSLSIYSCEVRKHVFFLNTSFKWPSQLKMTAILNNTLLYSVEKGIGQSDK